MNNTLFKSAFAVAATAYLLTGCSPEGLDKGPTPLGVHQDAYVSNQVPIDAVAVEGSSGGTYFFLSRSTEPSYGYKIYMWRVTAANGGVVTPVGSPNGPTYLSSPGAIDIAGRIDDSMVLILTASNDIYFQQGNDWVMLNSGGRKFLRIATDFFSISGDGQPGGSATSASGTLYAIGTDNIVYYFDVNTLTWSALNNQLAVDITVDATGHPWIVSKATTDPVSHAVIPGGRLFRSAGYGQTNSGWVEYPTPYAATSIAATTSYSRPGIAITTPSGPNQVYWRVLPSGGSTATFQPIVDNAVTPITSIFGDSNSFWYASGSTGNMFTGPFTGN